METHYIPLHKLKIKERYHPEFRKPLYAYPDYPAASSTVWGTTWFFDPNSATWSAEVQERNVPNNATALNEGAKVFSDDGQHVGNIKSIHTTDDSNRVTHFVISFEGYKLIPAFWVSKAKEEKVQLGVHLEILEKLPEHAFGEEA